MRPASARAARRTEGVEWKLLFWNDGQVCTVRWWRRRMTLSQFCFSFFFLSYKCGNYARFKDADGNLHDSTTLTCQWNRTWSGDLDECSCANIPLWISSEMS